MTRRVCLGCKKQRWARTQPKSIIPLRTVCLPCRRKRAAQ